MRWRPAAATAAFILLSAGSAAAEVYTWTFRGVVGLGEDDTGAFGAPGSDLTGLRWKAVVTTDTATPGAEIIFGDNYSLIAGSVTSPVVVSFTLNGVTRVFGADNPDPDGSYEGGQGQVEGPMVVYGFEADEYFTFQARNGSGLHSPELVHHRNDWIELGGVALGQDFLPGPDFRTLPSLTTPPGGVLFGYVSLYSYAENPQQGVTLYRESAWASLRALSVTAGAVPEPQTWALMILGFGAAGALLRRRYRFGRYATSTLPGIWPNEP